MSIDDNALEIHRLAPARFDDLLAFFDGEAFSDNPKWSSCYCQCFYEDHSKIHWPDRTASENRACAIERTRGGQMQGVLAYRDGKVVGWCNAAPRLALQALNDEPRPDADRVGTIMCFLVAPGARRQGVATALLDAACRHLASLGLSLVEANPHPDASDAGAHHYGTLSMYLAAGFAVKRSDADGSLWVEKALQSPPLQAA
jgi:GNAT superfamily N-acetyltransferase